MITIAKTLLPYKFTKENISKTLIRSLFEYPQLEKIIFIQKDQDNIVYSWSGTSVSIDRGYESWFTTKCGDKEIKVDVHSLINYLCGDEIRIRSIVEQQNKNRFDIYITLV